MADTSDTFFHEKYFLSIIAEPSGQMEGCARASQAHLH